MNNVGRSHEYPVSFAETPLEEQQSIININVNATMRVSQIVLGNMLQQYVCASSSLFPYLNFFSPTRRRGLVLTLSSFAGAIPSPLLATYSASKAFLQTWSDALQAELKGTGVDVECVSTYFVVCSTVYRSSVFSFTVPSQVSNMSRIRRSSALIPMPKAYVSSVLKKINLPCGALWTGL